MPSAQSAAGARNTGAPSMASAYIPSGNPSNRISRAESSPPSDKYASRASNAIAAPDIWMRERAVPSASSDISGSSAEARVTHVMRHGAGAGGSVWSAIIEATTRYPSAFK